MVSLRSSALFMVLMMVVTTSSGRLTKVGNGVWGPNVNYTEWASKHSFYVGDWIIFFFDKHMYTVLEVNKTSYDNCNDQGFITNITRGGKDVFELKEARPYYFLSTGGYCYNGMKLAILVEDKPVTPAPASTNAASSTNGSHLIFPIVISVVSTLIVLFT